MEPSHHTVVKIFHLQLVTLFEESGLPDFLGVTIRTCELTDEGLDLKFTADLSINTSVTIEMVERDFMMQLTGRDSNVVKPDSIILRNTLIVGDPGEDGR